ncbi:MAG: hypothetical protein ACREU4_12550, partial [Burkholderiales bacterium]
MNRPALRLSIVLLSALAAACAPFESLWKKTPRPDARSAAQLAPAPVLPLGEATHRFLVAADQDVVGRVQVTVAKHEDTFADIA